jgi:hypothetical protein
MHAVRFMQALHKAAQFFTQHLLHRHLVGRDHVHLDAAFAQGRRHFQTDKTGTEHDHPARRRGDDGAAVAQAAQRAHLRGLGARNV